MIVGAGAAGMEAARVAAPRGHEVTLFERASEVAPQIKLAATPIDKGRSDLGLGVAEARSEELEKY